MIESKEEGYEWELLPRSSWKLIEMDLDSDGNILMENLYRKVPCKKKPIKFSSFSELAKYYKDHAN